MPENVRSWSLSRRAMLNFKTTAMVCTIAHGVSGRPPAKCTGLLALRPPVHLPAAGCDFALCKRHKIACCPVCYKQQYVQQRVTKAVLSGLKRLHLNKTKSVLEYLGVGAWQEVFAASASCVLTSTDRNLRRCTSISTRSVSRGTLRIRTRR